MARRTNPYSVVLRGGRKEAARTKYLQFLAGTADRPSRIGSRGNRPPQILLSVKPFAANLPATIFARASALRPAVLAFQGIALVNTRVGAAYLAANLPEGVTLNPLGANDQAYRLGNFTAARVVRKIAASANRTVKVSETTGLKYGYVESDSLSLPFGKSSAAGDTEAISSAAIKDAVRAASPNAALTYVSIKPEIYSA